MSIHWKTDAEAVVPIFWPGDRENWLIGKGPDAGKDWKQTDKSEAKDDMVNSITDSVDIILSKLWEIVEDRKALHAAVHEWQRIGHNLVTEQ